MRGFYLQRKASVQERDRIGTHNHWIGVLFIISLFSTVGCTDFLRFSPQIQPDSTTRQEASTLTTTTQQRVKLSGDEFLHLTEDAVMITSRNVLQDRVRIPAQNPTEAIWTYKNRSVIWVESTESAGGTYYLIQEYTFESGLQRQLHLSKELMSELSQSSQSQFISYVENRSLYVLEPGANKITRVVEDLEEYRWSPELLGLTVTSSGRTEYIDFERDGSIVSRVELYEGGSLTGVAFRDHKTVVGFATDEDVVLIQVDLRDLAAQEVTQWMSGVDEEDLPTEIHSFVSPESNYLIVEEQKTNDVSALTLYSFSSDQKSVIQSADAFIDWVDEKTFLIAKNQTDSEAVDVYKADTQGGQQLTVAENVRYPQFIDQLTQ